MNLEELIFLLLNGKSDVFEFIKDVYNQTKNIPHTNTNNLIISRIDNKYAEYVSKITDKPSNGGGGLMSFTMTPNQIKVFNAMVKNIASLVKDDLKNPEKKELAVELEKEIINIYMEALFANNVAAAKLLLW